MKITITTEPGCDETEINVKCGRLDDDVEKLLAALRMLDMKLSGSRDGKQFILEIKEIIYIDSVDRRTFLYTAAGVFQSSLRLYELELKLTECDFLRVSKNCIINMNHIISIEPDFDRRLILTMTGNIILPVSRQYAITVKERLEAQYEK